jgi:hypothetical protein
VPLVIVPPLLFLLPRVVVAKAVHLAAAAAAESMVVVVVYAGVVTLVVVAVFASLLSFLLPLSLFPPPLFQLEKRRQHGQDRKGDGSSSGATMFGDCIWPWGRHAHARRLVAPLLLLRNHAGEGGRRRNGREHESGGRGGRDSGASVARHTDHAPFPFRRRRQLASSLWS